LVNLIERDHLENEDIDGRIILNWIVKSMYKGCEVD
jgi:hypothetical protein